MVSYIKSDLEFILQQIKISELHAAGQPLYGPGGLIPAYNVSWGLRTVDGTYNNLLHPEWGAADNEFPEPLGTVYRPADGTPLDLDGPGGMPPMATAPNYNPSSNPGSFVVDSSLRTISNLLVDQTLGNPSAILTAMQRAGIIADADQMAATAAISEAYAPLVDEFKAVSDASRANAEAQAAASANPGNAALQANAEATAAALAAAEAELDAEDDDLMLLLEDAGIELDGPNVVITNLAPDEGLSAPFNSWFTLFGQFFDHGLDLVAKGGNGTVFIPLLPDDPLYVPGGQTNFMVLTRATLSGPGADGILGTADDTNRPVNTTTAFVDQNQTYTSHASHQVFLREYVLTADGPKATGKLIEGADGGMATWGEVKAQARNILGIDLTDYHVGNLPLLATDEYGNFIPNAAGFPQVVMAGPPQTLASGTASAPLALVTVAPDGPDAGTAPDVTHLAVRTGHAFLADIAHNAVPEGKIDDGDIEIGLANPENGSTEYDNELLDAHFIAGDGRVNENIGLTAVHHVFHAEHNRLVEHTKSVVLASNDLAFINEWLAVDIAALPATPAEVGALVWDGERVFQAAKFGTEMQYQHLVFEEFARKIQPNINVFLVPDGYDVTIDPSIVAEFAHVVYRFGHSMLTETIDRFDASFNPDQIGLIEGFLNPLQFHNNGTNSAVEDGIAAGAIIRGMTRQAGNEIDEFVTSALRNNLLGLPLDLATINLARGRDTGVPTLNQARAQFYAATNQDSLLAPYQSWIDFAGHLKHEASIINFIAAYGTHALITGQTTVEGKRDAALSLITGAPVGVIPAGADLSDREDFLNGTGIYASSLGGLNNVDLWIGGLAEAIMPFGGMLGSTFNFVFEMQMEKLQNGDRFYYLQRLDGLHLFGEMENNSFAAMIMRNTDATHLPSDVFSAPGLILEVDRTKQYNPGLGETAGADGVLEDDPLTAVDESADNLGNDPTGGGILTQVVVRNNPATVGPDTNYLRYTGGEHVVLGGTSQNDILIAGIGDDTLYGDAGNDKLEGGFGNDIINAGEGDDIITDTGGDDNIKAGAGHDVVHAGPGLDLVMGNDGQDFIFLGTDMGSEVFAGTGNDFIYGNKNAERILGNEGDDWIETGTFDGAPGDNFDEIFAHDGIDGNDVFLGDGGFDEFIGEGGDDIMVGSPGRGKMAGMSGFDWATYKDNTTGVNADLSIPIIFDEAPTLPENAALDEYESMEGLSGTRFNDVLAGTEDVAADRAPLSAGGTTGYLGSALDAQGIAMIAGLQAVLGAGVTSFAGGDIILGGDGSDTIQGNGGDDIIDGDKWLNVRIGIMTGFNANGPTGTELAGNPNIKSMTSLVTLRLDVNGNVVTAPTGGTATTKALSAWMFEGKINPGQLQIVREITTTGADAVADVDTAVFRGTAGEYAFSATADGQVIVQHAIEDAIDGTDRLRNIEKIKFTGDDPDSTLNIIVGTPGNDTLNGTADADLILGLGGNDVLNGGAGNDILVGGPNSVAAGGIYLDSFNTASFTNSNGATPWTTAWAETNDGTGTANQIRIDDGNNVLRFYGGTGMNGAEITRVADLSSATSATITYTYDADNLEGAEQVRVLFAADGINYVLLNTIDGNDSGIGNHVVSGPFSATARIRFEAAGISATDENVEIDDLQITFSSQETLNGGLGDDTYSFAPGDGNDFINEGVSATSGGSADRISILSPVDLVTLVPVLTGLNAFDSNTGTNNGDLVLAFNGQTVTVNGHFTGTNAQTGVERINFNGATFAGYLLGSTDYIIGRLDPANRDSGGVNLSASLANNFLVGEQGTNDEIIGGLGNDIIIGGTGDNELAGGAGDDLLIGGSGAGDNDILDGGLDADTMVGLAGNDTYVVDDLADVVVEELNAGIDTVETEMAALSIELMTNVENLTYTGADADQFVGTGNVLDNVIIGGDLADTLSGLAGNDTLNGGIGADTLDGGEGNDTLNGGDDGDTLNGGVGADTLNGGAGADAMAGGADNDIYVVDDAGDVVTEAAAAGTDRVDASISYALGANVENLTLTGGDAINGIGNTLANVITGNGANNQLFGGDGGDTIDGGNGTDVIDGGLGDDTLSGGVGNDTDTIIGGAGNDTINLLAADGGNDVIVYNAISFGNDILTNFDATGGTAATQDLIDLSGLGITAANLATRVIESTVGANTVLTVRDASLATIGTIQINGITNANIDATDFILAAAAPATFGAPTNAANTITGNAGANTINGLGGNDTLSGAGGDDVINGDEGADTLNGGDGNDTLRGGTGSDNGSYADDFNTSNFGSSTGSVAWNPDWVEANDDNNAGGSGQIRIDSGGTNALRFYGGTTAAFNGAQITRTLDLAGATAAILTYSADPDQLDAGESLTVQFAADGVNFVNLQTITGNGGSVNYSHNLTGALSANSAVRFVVTALNATNEFVTVDNVAVNFTRPGLNLGVDTINGDAGDDTIVWNANASATDGRDLVNGGTEGAVGDTFVINGNDTAETFSILTRAAWDAIAGNDIANLDAATEIVVTRNGTNNAAIIAELREIEEIRINGADPSGSGGTVGGDTFVVAGDFSSSSLRLNTVTIDGTSGDDQVDISGLNSAHRVIYNSNGGNDRVLGSRPQDVIDGVNASVPKTYEINGSTTNQRITDFVKGDKIDFSAIDASRAGSGITWLLDYFDNDAFSGIAQGTAFGPNSAGQLLYHHEMIGGVGHTIIEGNTDNDDQREFQIELVGTFNLTNADFVL